MFQHFNRVKNYCGGASAKSFSRVKIRVILFQGLSKYIGCIGTHPEMPLPYQKRRDLILTITRNSRHHLLSKTSNWATSTYRMAVAVNDACVRFTKTDTL